MRTGLILLTAVSALAMPGCIVVARGYRPPPPAAAHGYRYTYDGVDLIYDADINVYVVNRYPDCYYHNGRFYRWVLGRWECSDTFRGKWVVAEGYGLPPGLAKKRYGSRSWSEDRAVRQSRPPTYPPDMEDYPREPTDRSERVVRDTAPDYADHTAPANQGQSTNQDSAQNNDNNGNAAGQGNDNGNGNDNGAGRGNDDDDDNGKGKSKGKGKKKGKGKE